MRNNNQGFTLLELMIAVVVLTVLAMIAIPMYQAYVARADQAQAQAQMLMLAERLENYRSRQLNYAGFEAEYESATEPGVIYLPRGSDATQYRYKIQLLDLNQPHSLQQSVIGQGWKMIATPQQFGSRVLRESPSYLLSSRQQQCATLSLLSSTAQDCGQDAQTW